MMYDVVIIGSGIVGLSAAVYSGRLELKSLVIGKEKGGTITKTHIVENYPGIKSISGPDLADKMLEHARDYKTEIKNEEVLKIVQTGKSCFNIKTDKEEYSSKTILFCTGSEWKKLNVKGEREFANKGVHYCALCDGPLYKNKIVAIVGGSDSAAKDALLLSEHAKKVYIIYRGEEIHPEPINLQRIKANKKIEVINSTNIKEVKGEKFVNSVILDKKYKGKENLELDGVFVAIGHIILSDLAKASGVKLNEKGEIKINHMTSETNIPGVFAAGDVTDKQFKQLITGVADGCTAAYSAYEHIQDSK